MRHIKIFEDYSDDDLKDLMGELRDIGQTEVKFDVEFEDYPETEAAERNAAGAWRSKVNSGIFLTSVEGSISEETADLDLVFSNGDLVNFDFYFPSGPSGYSKRKQRGIFTLNNKIYDIFEKYMTLLEDGSVMGAILNIYDEIKTGKKIKQLQ